MSWSTGRKLIYLLLFLSLVFSASFYFSYPLLKENPTCTDGKQNGNEEGVDCGGTCPNLCVSSVRPIGILWTRAFQVAPGIYDAMAYIENQNVTAGVPNILYRFKLYDDKNVLIAERDGRTFIGPNQSTAIFEGQINTGQTVPKMVFLEFEDGYSWIKTDMRFSKIDLSADNKNLTDLATFPRLSATVTNNSLVNLSNIPVAVIIRDSEDNALAVSETVIDNLPKQDSRDVFFTWPKAFSSAPSRIEIIPRVNPFTVAY